MSDSKTTIKLEVGNFGYYLYEVSNKVAFYEITQININRNDIYVYIPILNDAHCWDEETVKDDPVAPRLAQVLYF